MKRELDLSGMPVLPLPVLSDAKFLLPELVRVGRMFDFKNLVSLCPLADSWCRLAERSPMRAGSVLRLLRVAAEIARATQAARAAAGPEADG